MRNLILNYWKSENEERSIEVDRCIKQNLESKLFDRLIFFVIDSQKDHLLSIFNNIDYGNIQVKIFNSFEPSITYQKIIDICNTVVGTEDVNILSNSDIVFDETIKLADMISTKEIYALTRYNDDILDWHVPPAPEYATDSQDVWIWKGINVLNSEIPIYMGVPGCDNRISYDFFISGYVVRNPCLSIKTHHVHKTNSRPGTSTDISKRIMYPYLFLKPTKLGDFYGSYLSLHNSITYQILENEIKKNNLEDQVHVALKEFYKTIMETYK
jgi:hypothetical protein